MIRLALALFTATLLLCGCPQEDPPGAERPAPDLSGGRPVDPNAGRLAVYGWLSGDLPDPPTFEPPTREAVDAAWAKDVADARAAVRERFPAEGEELVYVPPTEAETLFGLDGTFEPPPYEFPPAEECRAERLSENYEALLYAALDREAAKDPPGAGPPAEVLDDLKKTVRADASEGFVRERPVPAYASGEGRLAPLAAVWMREDRWPEPFVRQTLHAALAALREDGVDPLLRFHAARGLVSQLERPAAGDVAAYADAAADALAALDADGSEEAADARRYLTNVLQRHLLRNVWPLRWSLLGRLSERTAEDGLNPFPLLLLMGRTHRTVAWQARGNGFADTVPDTAWPVFRKHMGIASGYYQAAYLADEGGAEVIGRLINASNTTDVGATPRQWLMAAIRADRQAWDAVDAYAFTLTPKWGGSQSQMTDFARALVDVDEFGPGGLSWCAFEAVDEVYGETSSYETLMDWPDLRGTLAELAAAVAEADAGAVDKFRGRVETLMERLTYLQMYPELLTLYRAGVADRVGGEWPTYAARLTEAAELYGDDYLDLAKCVDFTARYPDEEEAARAREALLSYREEAAEQGAETPALVRIGLRWLDVAERLRAGEWVEVSVAPGSQLVTYYAEEWEHSEDGQTVTMRGTKEGPRLQVTVPFDGVYEVEAEVSPRRHPAGSVESPFGVMIGRHAYGTMAWVQASPASVGFQQLPFEKQRPHAYDRPPGEFVWLGLRTGEEAWITINGQEAGPFKANPREVQGVTVGGLAYWPGPQAVAVRNVRVRRTGDAPGDLYKSYLD